MPDEPSTPPGEHEEDDPGLLGGLLDKAGAATERFALRPARAVARQGRDALTDEAERAIDGVMAGPLPEAVGRSVVENRVIERVVSEASPRRPRSRDRRSTRSSSASLPAGCWRVPRCSG